MINALRSIGVKNWSRIGKGKSEEELISKRPFILLSQFAIAGLFGAVIHVSMDLFNKSYETALLNSWFILFLAIVYISNEKGFHQFAKFFFLIVTNFSLFVYANILSKEAGIYFLFFPMIGGSFIFLLQDKPLVKRVFVTLPIILLFLLELTSFKFFGEIEVDDKNIYASFILNMALSTAVFSVAINYLFKLNKRSEQILREKNSKVKKMALEIEEKNETLEKANKELDRFAYSTSHDLRAPLTSMLGLIHIAKNECIQPGITGYLDMMENRINSLDKFIKDITDYSRNSRMEIAPEDIDFNNLIDDVLENYRYLNESSHINFTKNINLQDTIKTDRGRLQVVLNNLVNNAIKYHDHKKQRPEISLRVDRVTEKEFSIAVKDNGPGIPVQIKDRVFDMFYRASEKSNGSGLGLYIVKETVEKMNGNIQLKTKEGVGSEFKVNLPICDN